MSLDMKIQETEDSRNCLYSEASTPLRVDETGSIETNMELRS